MILVSDTSVLIDLDRGGLLEAVFVLPHAFAVPDVLYDRELQGEWGEQLQRLGLRVEEVSEAGVGNALVIASSAPRCRFPTVLPSRWRKSAHGFCSRAITRCASWRQARMLNATACYGCWTNWRKPARRAFNSCMMGCLSWLHIHDAACRRAKLRSGLSGTK